MVHSYNFLVKHQPEIFRKLYYYTDTKKNKNTLKTLLSLTKEKAHKLIEAVNNYNPDRIICTHFLPPVLLKSLAEKYPIDVVVTDYYMHKTWNFPLAKTIFLASEHTKQNAPKTQSSYVVSGIPVDPIFYQTKNKNDLFKKHKLFANTKTILLLSGGVCLIDISKTVEKILSTFSNLNIVVVSGKNNKKTYKKLCALDANKNNYKVLEHTTEIDEWMRLADIIITKPGGLTISECMVLQKPLILVNPIPGQEEENARYLVKNNFGLLAENENSVTKHLATILNNPHVLTTPPKLPRATTIILDHKN
jgi:processive 1,2-diacylglycerol beta-glucosyltransferase